MKTGVQRKSNRDALRKALNALTKKRVLVGIPSGSGNQTGGDIPLANVGYIMETGAPARNIPARPWLKPGIGSVQQKIAAIMKKGAQDALDKFDRPSECTEAVEAAQNGVGLAAQVGVKAYIDSTIPPPLSASTLHNRQHRKDQPNDRDRPLRDKDDLYRAINYVIRDSADGQ